jgi:hypothetical protein
MTTSDFIDVEQFLFNKGFSLSDTASVFKVSLTPVYELLLKRKRGQISAADSAIQINNLKAIDSRDEYNKYFYKNGLTQQHSINIKGGSEKVAWLISGSFNKALGNLQTSYNKVNIRLENSFKLTNNLQINFGAYYTDSKANNTGAPAYNSITTGGKPIPYLRVVDGYGNPIAVDSRYRGIYTDTVGGGRLLNWKYYPSEDYKHDKRTTKINELIANFGINYSFLKHFSINVNYQYQKQSVKNERLADLQSFFTRDLINTFTKLRGGSSGQDIYRIPRGNILDIANSSILSQNLRGQLNFNKNWIKHSISTIIGSEVREVVSNGDILRLYGLNENPFITIPVDFSTPYPTLITGNFAFIPAPPFLNKTIVNRFVSVYGNAAYTYKQRYSVSISGRKDASNVFGVNTNDKWSPLWSTGLGWEVSKEHFYSISWLSYLKFRASFGYSGNVDLSKSALPISVSQIDPISNLPVQRIGTLNNPSLRWEKSQQTNFGVDFSTANQIITGSVEYYLKIGKDLYGAGPIDYTAWGANSQIVQNVANTTGKGIDISIQSKNVQGKISWTTNVLFSYNSTKVTSYFNPPGSNISSLLQENGNTIIPIVGKPLFAIAAYKWGGLNGSGDPQGYLNGQLSTDYDAILNEAFTKGVEGNIKYVGPANPTSFGALINRINWKGISVAFNISYKVGYYFVKPTLSYYDLYYFGASNRDFEKRWKTPGDELKTNVPSMVYTNYPQFSNRDVFYAKSEVNVLKGDHIRFQYINVDYTIVRKNKRLPFERLQFYINAANLGIIWRANSEKLDPDYPNTFTPSKQFTFGLRAII